MLKGRFDKSLEILYKKWSRFVKEMMLNDFFFFCLHNEDLIVKFVSGKSMLFAYHLIGTCPFFLRVYSIMWVFKIAYLK